MNENENLRRNNKSKSKKRQSVEQRLDQMSDTLAVMKEFFMTKMKSDGENKMVSLNEKRTAPKEKQSTDCNKDKGTAIESTSETTVYHNALNKLSETEVIVDPEITFRINETNEKDQHCNSSSSEERIDTSDELMDVDIDQNPLNERFIADCEAEACRKKEDQPGHSAGRGLVREAEAHRAWIYNTPGNAHNAPRDFAFDKQVYTHPEPQVGLMVQSDGWNENIQMNSQAGVERTPPGFVHQSVSVDESYLVIGMHVDESTQEKIKKSEYVDFAKLISKEQGDENKMELIFKNGQTYFVPAVDRENLNVISSLFKWEQAFRIFSNIYPSVNPGRVTELIQYNHIICTAAGEYLWDNVYAYDKEFRKHIAKFPSHSWVLILQQAWTMILKDRISKGSGTGNRSSHSSGQNQHINKSDKDACKQFNKGICTNQLGCHYDHRCLTCGRFGHGAHICRAKKINKHHNKSLAVAAGGAESRP